MDAKERTKAILESLDRAREAVCDTNAGVPKEYHDEDGETALPRSIAELLFSVNRVVTWLSSLEERLAAVEKPQKWSRPAGRDPRETCGNCAHDFCAHREFYSSARGCTFEECGCRCQSFTFCDAPPPTEEKVEDQSVHSRRRPPLPPALVLDPAVTGTVVAIDRMGSTSHAVYVVFGPKDETKQAAAVVGEGETTVNVGDTVFVRANVTPAVHDETKTADNPSPSPVTDDDLRRWRDTVYVADLEPALVREAFPRLLDAVTQMRTQIRDILFTVHKFDDKPHLLFSSLRRLVLAHGPPGPHQDSLVKTLDELYMNIGKQVHALPEVERLRARERELHNALSGLQIVDRSQKRDLLVSSTREAYWKSKYELVCAELQDEVHHRHIESGDTHEAREKVAQMEARLCELGEEIPT